MPRFNNIFYTELLYQTSFRKTSAKERIFTMIKACIFDLDGTLANTLPTLCYVGNTALENCGFNTVDDARYPTLIGNGANNLVRSLITIASGREPNDCILKYVRAEYDKIYAADPLHLTVPYDGIIALLAALGEREIKTAVLSNKPHDMTLRVIDGLFEHKFDAVFGQREGVARKPSPDAALEIAGMLGVSPNEMLFIGDSGVDMKTGINAGMTSVGVLWGFREREELLESGAHHLIASPDELLNLL